MFDFYSGLVTIIICALGAFVSLKHFFFYCRADRKLCRKLKFLFLTDGMIYGITFMFGLWALFHWDHFSAMVLHWVRHPILAMNIYASYSLYKHYKEV